MERNFRAALKGEVAKLQASMNEEIFAQMANVQRSPGDAAVRPLSQLSSSAHTSFAGSPPRASGMLIRPCALDVRLG
jgi:hypothetical protein